MNAKNTKNWLVGKARKPLILCLSAIVSFVAGTAHADDLDLYRDIAQAQENIGDGGGDFNPNVLFVLDNSGSMSRFRLVSFDGEPAGGSTTYDPTQNYVPAGESGDSLHVYYTNGRYTGIEVPPEQNNCKAATDYFDDSSNSGSFYNDQFVQWSYSRTYGPYWYHTLYNTSDTSRDVIECENDHGVHGDGNDAGKPYLGYCLYNCDRNTPSYSNSAKKKNNGDRYRWEQARFNRITWGAGNEYSLASANYHHFLTGNSDVVAAQDTCESISSGPDPVTRTINGKTFVCMSKLKIMKTALNNVVAGGPSNPTDPTSENLPALVDANIGLMRFNNNTETQEVIPGSCYRDRFGNRYCSYARTTIDSGTLIDAVENVSAYDQGVDANGDPNESGANPLTNRQDFVNKLEAIRYELYTPLAESMYEAYRYYGGMSPIYSETSSGVSGQPTLDSKAVPEQRDEDNNLIASAGSLYKSPSSGTQCQKDYVVLLTDGVPYNDGNLDGTIVSLPGNVDDSGNQISDCNGSCLDDAARAMKNDFDVTTYTIGFDIDIDILADAADAGSDPGTPSGAGYFVANDLETLQGTFSQILSEIQAVGSDTFVAPAVTVNSFNRLQNRDDIYYAVFEPELSPRWQGNLKKYRLDVNTVEIQDAAGVDAVDDETGFFKETAKSFWSNEVDGAIVDKGGLIGEMSPYRTLYANLDDSNTITALGSPTNPNSIRDFKNAIIDADNTGAILGIDTSLPGALSKNVDNGTGLEENFESVIRFSLGEDVEGLRPPAATGMTSNQYAADTVHSTPFVISYGDETHPQDIVFMMTNQGVMHAVTGQGVGESDGLSTDVGGQERWAYVPDPSLLKNLGGYFNRQLNGVSDKHIYGLDGGMTVDLERDATTKKVTKAHAYIAQRRGGSKYFAIDLTNADGAAAGEPVVKKLWTIESGSADGLHRLGQTWANPVLANYSDQAALVLSGGYDTAYDNVSVSASSLADSENGNNTKGNAIYIVRSEDEDGGSGKGGDVLWAVSNRAGALNTARGDLLIPEMKHSIPSPPVVLDIDKDGNVDTMFAIDVVGQIFRIDFKNGEASGGVIADLQESGVDRRFYNPVDAVLLPSSDDGAPVRFALVTGSGDRTNPTSREGFDNRYYVVYDQNIRNPEVDASGDPNYDYVVATGGGAKSVISADSGDIEELQVGNLDTAPLLPNSTHRYGYYFPLQDQTSEKIINPSLIADFQVIGVSYLPSGVVTGVCSAAPGTSNTYRHDLLSGEIEVIALKKAGVSAAPVLVYILVTDPSGVESLKPIVIIGTEPIAGEDLGLQDPELGKAKRKAWWESGRGN